MSNNISIKGSLSLSQTNTPTRSGERITTESDIFNIETPYIGMIVYIEDQDKYVSVKSLKSKKVGFKTIENAQVNTYESLITSSKKESSVGPEWEQCWIPVVGSIEEASINGGMVSLKENLTLTNTLSIKEDVILNLNNKNISGTLKVLKSLIIKGKGNINGGSGNIYSRSILDIENGYCEIHSGDFIISSSVNNSGISCCKITDGTLKISGGTFEANNGQIINSENSVIEITGGIFKNFNPEMYIAKGYKSVLDTSTNSYKVVKE